MQQAKNVIGSNVSELLEVSVKQLFPNCEADPPGGTESHCKECVVEQSEHKVCRRGKEYADGTLFYLHFSFDPLNYKKKKLPSEFLGHKLTWHKKGEITFTMK